VKEHSFLFPVLIHGYGPVLKGTAVILSGNADLVVLLLLRYHLKKSYSFIHMLVLTMFLSFLVIGPVIGSISSFGPNVAANLRFPALEQWRLVTLGSYVSHLDFLAVFQLLSGITIKVTLCFVLLSDLLELGSEKMARIGKYVIPALFFSVIFFKSDIWVMTIEGTYIYPYLFGFGFFISILLLAISFLPVRKGV
jgi:spore germination protein KB